MSIFLVGHKKKERVLEQTFQINTGRGFVCTYVGSRAIYEIYVSTCDILELGLIAEQRSCNGRGTQSLLSSLIVPNYCTTQNSHLCIANYLLQVEKKDQQGKLFPPSPFLNIKRLLLLGLHKKHTLVHVGVVCSQQARQQARCFVSDQHLNKVASSKVTFFFHSQIGRSG